MFQWSQGPIIHTRTRTLAALFEALGNIGGVSILMFGFFYAMASIVNRILLQENLVTSLVYVHNKED